MQTVGVSSPSAARIKTMARSGFMANGVEAGSAIGALQSVLGTESAVAFLKALRGTNEYKL